MADDARPMSTMEVQKGLGSLLATLRGADQPGAVEGTEPEVVPDEEQDEDVSLADQGEEEGPGSEFSLTYKYKGKDYQITDPAEAAKYVQLGKHLSERQDEIVTREKAVEQAATEADQHRTRYAAALSEAAQFFEQIVGEPPKESDFKDRASYAEALIQHDQARQAVSTYRAELQRVQAEQAEAQQQRLAKWAEDQEHRTLAAVPEWHDTAVRQADVKAMQDYAETIGVPAEALQSPFLANASWFRLMLRDATRYKRAADVGSAEVRKKKTKDAAPGTTEVRSEGRNRARRTLEERMKSGKIDDVAPLATQLLQRHKQLQQTKR